MFKKIFLALPILTLAACGVVALEGEVATMTPIPTATPLPTSPPLPGPTLLPTPQTAAVLPQPVYFLSAQNQQIWRIEPDGLTLRQITREIEPVTDYDVSPVDGRLVYVSANDLYRADAFGEDRTLLVDGVHLDGPVEGSRFTVEVYAPRWSADGQQVFFAQNGINFISADGADGPHVILPNGPYPKDGIVQPDSFFYEPVSVSPDGRWLLAQKIYFPHGGRFIVLMLNTGAAPIELLTPNDAPPCCAPLTWAADSATLYLANPALGMFSPGLWKVTLPGDTFVPMLPGYTGADGATPTPEDTFNFVAYPFEGPGALYALAATRPAEDAVFETRTYLALSRVETNGTLTTLRSDQYLIGEALGAADGSGVLIVDINANPDNYPYQGQLRWLTPNDTAPFALAAEGRLLKWGK